MFLVCLAHEAASHPSANKSNLVKEVLVLKLRQSQAPACISNHQQPNFISYIFMAWFAFTVAFKRNKTKTSKPGRQSNFVGVSACTSGKAWGQDQQILQSDLNGGQGRGRGGIHSCHHGVEVATIGLWDSLRFPKPPSPMKMNKNWRFVSPVPDSQMLGDHLGDSAIN